VPHFLQVEEKYSTSAIVTAIAIIFLGRISFRSITEIAVFLGRVPAAIQSYIPFGLPQSSEKFSTRSFF